MRKIVITAATLAMSTALAGFAYAATSGGPTAREDSAVVSTVSTEPSTATSPAMPTQDAPDDSDGRVGGGHGADDVNDAPEDSDGRIGGGHGADDSSGPGSGEDSDDDNGSGGSGSDD